MSSETVVKNVVIYKNGDQRFAGKRFLINKKQTRTYDAFLNQVTIGLSPTFGAVRRLLTPENGHRVKDFDDLQAGSEYVASGLENFKKINYKTIKPAAPIGSRKAGSPPLPEITPVRHSRIVASGRIKRYVGAAIEPKIVFVHANGNDIEGAHRILLTPRELQNWELVLTAIGERVRIPTGAIKWLYTLDGEMVVNLHDITSGEHYVAVGNERQFRNLGYGKTKAPIDLSPRPSRKSYHLPPLKRGSQDTTSPSSVQSTQSRRANKTRKQDNKPLSDDPYHARGRPPPARRPPPRDTSQKKDDDQVFRAKKKGPSAAQVDENDDTKTEKTVDQRKAETVDDEDIEDEGNPREQQREEAKRRQEEEERRRQAELEEEKRRQEREEQEIQERIRQEEREEKRRRQQEEEERKVASRQSVRSNGKTVSRPNSAQQSENDADKKAAATKIAAGYKGYKVRKDIKTDKQQKERKQAATKIQAGYRGHKTRQSIKKEKQEKKETNESKGSGEKDDKEKAQAAAKIQAGYRGHKTRAAIKKDKKEKEQKQAAVKIQAGYRGHKTRKEVKAMKAQKA